MLPEYLPLVMLAALAAGFVVVSLLVSHKLGPSAPNPVKSGPYESGIVPGPETDVRGSRFAVKFYLVAMLFIVFDVEAVFFHPWATVVHDFAGAGHGWYVLIAMVIFVALLFESYYYVLRKGGLRWD